MQLQKLLSLTRQAVDRYQMIGEGDYIAVGVSGGKDSLTLLYALAKLRTFYPKPFSLCAITVDLGFPGFETRRLQELCSSLEVPYYVVPTQIGPILFDERKEKNPCPLCAKMRKGALNQKAIELGCTKIAYAHHQDDVIETIFLSMFYEGRMQTLEPFFPLDGTPLTVIRPLIYVSEAEVIGFKNRYALPVEKNPCPADGNTRREYVKDHVRGLYLQDRGIKKKIFHAIETDNEMWRVRRLEAEEKKQSEEMENE